MLFLVSMGVLIIHTQNSVEFEMGISMVTKPEKTQIEEREKMLRVLVQFGVCQKRNFCQTQKKNQRPFCNRYFCHISSFQSGRPSIMHFYIGDNSIPFIGQEEQKYLGKVIFFSGKSKKICNLQLKKLFRRLKPNYSHDPNHKHPNNCQAI